MTAKPYDKPVRIVVRLRGKLADLDRDLAAIEQGVKGDFNGPLNTDVKAAHRAAHKPGVPLKIEADPEVKAFIQARLDTMTFDDIVAALKAAFPPERHVSRSSLHRWWQKIGRFSQPKAT
jgi:hypothetical protein